MSTAKLILICIVFVAGGILMLNDTDAPEWVGWINILFFGTGGFAVLAITIYQRFFPPKPSEEDMRQVRLRDGRDCEVHLSDHEIKLTDRAAQETKSIHWSDLTDVYAIAIDDFPVGSISWVLHKDSEVLEIPWDAKNADELLARMQTRLPGFDSKAVIEISSVLHGFKKVWSKS